jgi:hypothetical protein
MTGLALRATFDSPADISGAHLPYATRAPHTDTANTALATSDGTAKIHGCPRSALRAGSLTMTLDPMLGTRKELIDCMRVSRQ